MEAEVVTLISQIMSDGGLIAFAVWRMLAQDKLVDRLLEERQETNSQFVDMAHDAHSPTAT